MSNLTDFFRTVGHTTKFLTHKKCPEKKSAAENFKDISWIQTQLATCFTHFSTSFVVKQTPLLAAFLQTFIPKRYRSGCFHKGGIQPIPRFGLGIQKRNLNWKVNGELYPESTPPGCNRDHSSLTLLTWFNSEIHLIHVYLGSTPPPRMVARHHQNSETFWGSGITTTKTKAYKCHYYWVGGGVDPNYISKWFVVPKIIYKGIDFLQNERFSDVCIASI